MRLAFTSEAEQGLETIADYIASDNPVRALSFVHELRAKCQRITFNPSGYRLRPELGGRAGVPRCSSPSHLRAGSTNAIRFRLHL